MLFRKRVRFRRYIWLLLLCTLLAACVPASSPAVVTSVPAAPMAATAMNQPVAAPPNVPAPRAGDCLGRGAFPPLLAELRYGVNAFLLHIDQERVVSLARTAGFGWLRQQIHWRDIETRPGGYDWGPLDLAVDAARRADLHILLSVVRSPAWATASRAGGLPDDPALLGAFMRALAARYAGRVSAYEIWNEPNLAVENGGRAATPAQYLAVLQAAYAAVKQADPCALVLSAPLAATAIDDPAVAADDLRFYRGLYALQEGRFLRAADIVAIHPGGGDHPVGERWPDGAPERSREYFRHIEAVRALMEQAGDRRQTWITEVGWTTWPVEGAPAPVSPEQQALNLVGALRLTRATYPWVAAIFVWNLNFAVLDSHDEKGAFGILKPDWSPQPAYLALQAYLGAQAIAAQGEQPRFSASAPYQSDWRVRVTGKIHMSATLAPDGTAYIGSDPGRLYAVAPAGGVRWIFAAPGATRDPPAQGADGTLYLGDQSGALTALSPDGAVVWQRTLGAGIRGTPQLAGDALYITTESGEALRLDLAGNILWRVALGAPAAPALLARPRRADPALLYVPTASGEVLALTADGAVRWRTQIGEPVASAAALADVPGGAAQLLVGDAAGYLSSLDALDGQLRWRRRLVERVESPTLPPSSALIGAPPLVGGDGALYLGGRDGVVTALDLAGNTRWRYETGSDISATPLQGPDGSIYVGLYDKRLIALDPRGRLRWQVGLNGAVRSRPLIAPDGALYVGTVGGILYRLAAAAGRR